MWRSVKNDKSQKILNRHKQRSVLARQLNMVATLCCVIEETHARADLNQLLFMSIMLYANSICVYVLRTSPTPRSMHIYPGLWLCKHGLCPLLLFCGALSSPSLCPLFRHLRLLLRREFGLLYGRSGHRDAGIDFFL